MRAFFKEAHSRLLILGVNGLGLDGGSYDETLYSDYRCRQGRN